MQILLTNDDGVHSQGIKSLAAALRQLGVVHVVAPIAEQSGVSHALTFRVPLFAKQMVWEDGTNVWAVEGTPADCTRLGIFNLLPQPPDIVVSGTNLGLNVGCNVIYSGTLAGAEEGAMLGIDSFAASLEYDENPPWEQASAIVTQVIRQIVDLRTKKNGASLTNINVPVITCYSQEPVEVCVVPVDPTPLYEPYSVHHSPYDIPYYWLSGKTRPQDATANTDRNMLKKGFVTVTPLEYNRTNRAAIESLEMAFIDKQTSIPLDAVAENPLVGFDGDNHSSMPAEDTNTKPHRDEKQSTGQYTRGSNSEPNDILSPYSEGT